MRHLKIAMDMLQLLFAVLVECCKICDYTSLGSHMHIVTSRSFGQTFSEIYFDFSGIHLM